MQEKHAVDRMIPTRFCFKLDQLETDPSRPLSSSREALRQLYDQRIDLYRAACDQQIENNGSADETARRLWQDWLMETTGLIRIN